MLQFSTESSKTCLMPHLVSLTSFVRVWLKLNGCPMAFPFTAFVNNTASSPLSSDRKTKNFQNDLIASAAFKDGKNNIILSSIPMS